MYVNAGGPGHLYFCWHRTNQKMKTNIKFIVTKTLTVIVTLIVVAGGILKLVSMPVLVDIYAKIGMLSYLKALGITEILFAILFLWRRTMRLGFLLLTGYLGGAMAVELSHGTFFIAPGLILTMIWIAAYLRDASTFASASDKSESSLATETRFI
jgi:hypothetical protein